MGGPGSGASFFGGLAKGFGESFSRARYQKRQEEREDEERQMKVFQYALNHASQTGDTNAIADILSGMKEFAQVGVTKKGKKKREAQQDIMDVFIGKLKGGQPTPEAQEATQTNEQLIQEGTPELATRPRLATEKPLLMGRRELAQRNIEEKVAEEEALLPTEMKKYEQQQRIMGNRIKEQREADINAKLAADLLRYDAQGQIKAKKRIDELTAATGDPTRAKELFLMEVQADINKDVASANLSNVRASYIDDDYKLRKERAERQFRHWDATEARALEASQRGDRRLSTVLQKADFTAKRLSLNADLSKMRQLNSRIATLQKESTNTLNSPEDRATAKGQLQIAMQQWATLSETVNRKQDELDELDNQVNAITGESTTTGVTPSQPGQQGQGKSRKAFGLRLPPKGGAATTTRPHKVIVEKATGKKYKFYGYKPDGTPDMEPIP